MSELNLISIRGTLFTAAMPTKTIAQPRFRPPRLALLPSPTPPAGGLFVSAITHVVAVFALLTWLPLLFPGRPVLVTNADILRDPNHEVHFIPILPRIENAGAHSAGESGPKKKAVNPAKPEAEASAGVSNPPKPDFAGPQEIVSDLPDSTNNVQTIRRPDLAAPPKLPNPIRLQSLVMLPAHAQQAPVAPQVVQPLQPVLPNPVELAPLLASEHRVQVPELPMGVPTRSSVVPSEPVMPKVAATFDQDLPTFAPTAPIAPKAVVVINAVGVPPESSPVIPDAELSGKFVVGPSSDVGRGNAGSASVGGSAAGAGTSNNGGNSSHGTGGNGSGTVVAINGGQIGAGRGGSITIMGGRSGSGGAGTGSGSGAGTGAGTGARSGAGTGNGSMPGISISGGTTTSRGGVPVTTGAISRGSYSITVISGGSSGGASRNLGVFSRDDTVYTVYIPMAGAGGGPDWPMEYALTGPAPAGNGLLTPPAAVKKVHATRPRADLTENSGLVFVTGTIDENGILQALRAIRALDARVQAALDAIEQWEFLPAQLDGKPVACRILIGVSVTAAGEVEKQN